MGEVVRADLDRMFHEVTSLRNSIVEAETRHAAHLEAVRPVHRYSATNLIHYVELRRHDIRDLQARLSEHALSSLGGTESHVLVSIDALLVTLALMTGRPQSDKAAPGVPDGVALLSRNAVGLLGPQPADRATRIMVTLPAEAAAEPSLVHDMLNSGMDVARINCAHDGPLVWESMLAHIRAGSLAAGRTCLVSMDLGGPKLRTGPLTPGPPVLKVRPTRDALGAVVEPAQIWLGAAPPDAGNLAHPVVPLHEGTWAGARRVGERIRLVDARGSRRTMTVEMVTPTGCLVSLRHTAYLVPGTVLAVDKKSGASSRTAHVGMLPTAERKMLVQRGDVITLTTDLTPAPLMTGALHRIGCTLPEIFADAKPGERVLFDDGKIGGVITGTAPGELTVGVRSAGAAGSLLGAEKGINFPDTRISVSAMTDQDVQDLAFVATHADIVEMSFVRSEKDVRELLRRLRGMHASRLGVVLKIETVAAFDSLPKILLEAMRWDRIGVMIARGDLAVEAGFERLSEVQEEILWLCEAAHVPVIWATEVLDTMARTGVPSRPEVTDAAMAERAECVMLNKGPYIVEAINMLAGILGRMQDHVRKKHSLLRRLRAWDATTTANERENFERSLKL
ncbi:pyruvate kinase [soil metagenome]